MESFLSSGIVVDKYKSSYIFYYKPLANNSGRKITRKTQKFKCYLHVGLWSPQHIHINDFDCKGRGGGDGKFLFCGALNYLKSTLGLADDTLVSLTAISTDGSAPRTSQDKLINYYSRTYGFEAGKEDLVADMYRTDMTATIKTVLEKCSETRQNKTIRQKISSFLGRLKTRWTRTT
jgi:hypothetical protein